mmetsp:Transcript_8014/g.12271  ORF Transcript_8014/g.12271 Transcript_8014/m.12271 type:complete len:205 (+) Transcript_8014:467-1081(+)
MPGNDTGDLTETSIMSITVESGDTESLDHTGHTLTAGNTDSIDALVVLEDLINANLLLEFSLGPVDLLSDGATVNLDFHDVGLVLTEGELANLSGADDTDDGCVLLDSLKISGVVSLARLVLVFAVNVLAEGLLHSLYPVRVESALDIVVQVPGPDGGESAETTWGWDITDQTNDLHWWALNDGDGVDDILLDRSSYPHDAPDT